MSEDKKEAVSVQKKGGKGILSRWNSMNKGMGLSSGVELWREPNTEPTWERSAALEEGNWTCAKGLDLFLRVRRERQVRVRSGSGILAAVWKTGLRGSGLGHGNALEHLSQVWQFSKVHLVHSHQDVRSCRDFTF